MAYALTFKDLPVIEIDADEHSIEPAVSTAGISTGPEVVRFWKAEQVVTGTHYGPKKRELVAVVPFDQVLILERI
jgi:valyl-tRNA synthetase